MRNDHKTVLGTLQVVNLTLYAKIKKLHNELISKKRPDLTWDKTVEKASQISFDASDKADAKAKPDDKKRD